MFRVKKSVNVFRIDGIAFEINLINDKQNKIVNVLLNDRFKRQDEFCGKDKSISLLARPKNGAHCRGREQFFTSSDLWITSVPR